MEKILITCAHPDDETLGLGGTIKLHTLQGNKVFVLIFADGESGRTTSSNRIKQRKSQAEEARTILGINEIKFLDYPDQRLDTIPVLELSKQIELQIKKWKPTVVYTHFWGDVNQDHKRVFEATLIATRPIPKSRVDRFICFETPSSTEWGYQNVKPNLFVDIQKVLDKKLKAFRKYKNEVMKYPHPRSEKAIIDKSRYWGTTVGIKHAEAFYVLRELIRN